MFHGILHRFSDSFWWYPWYFVLLRLYVGPVVTLEPWRVISWRKCLIISMIQCVLIGAKFKSASWFVIWLALSYRDFIVVLGFFVRSDFRAPTLHQCGGCHKFWPCVQVIFLWGWGVEAGKMLTEISGVKMMLCFMAPAGRLRYPCVSFPRHIYLTVWSGHRVWEHFLDMGFFLWLRSGMKSEISKVHIILTLVAVHVLNNTQMR